MGAPDSQITSCEDWDRMYTEKEVMVVAVVALLLGMLLGSKIF